MSTNMSQEDPCLAYLSFLVDLFSTREAEMNTRLVKQGVTVAKAKIEEVKDVIQSIMKAGPYVIHENDIRKSLKELIKIRGEKHD